jgi:hypothetical protein
MEALLTTKTIWGDASCVVNGESGLCRKEFKRRIYEDEECKGNLVARAGNGTLRRGA